MQELWNIADTCTVLRDGRLIGSENMCDLDRRELIEMMFGDVEIRSRPNDLKYSDEVLLKVEGLSDGRKFSNVSFELRKR